MRSLRLVRFLVVALFVHAGLAFAGAIPNWPAPPAWAPTGGKGLMGELSNPLPFEPVTPCRVADTRGFGFSGAYGPPALAPQSTRSFTITGQCGIPATARAVSFQFTVTGMSANGNLTAFPQGTPLPTSSVLNWNASSVVIGNGTVVALSSSGGLSIFSNSAANVDLIIDVNGYYYDAFLGGVGNLPAGRFFGITGDVPGGSNGAGVIFGHNTNAGSSNSWGGEFITDSCNAGSAGVFGQAYPSGACGAVFGVWGRTNSNFAASAGVLGEATGSPSAAVYGVQGSTTGSSSVGAGVYGVATASLNNGGKFYNSAGPVTTYLATTSAGTNYSLIGSGVVYAAGLNITGSKNFVAPHPLDASKEIRYASVEAPTVDVYFRGTATMTNGYARIDVPEHFRLTAREGTYMTTLTSVGRAGSLSVESEGSEGIVVRGSGSGRFHFVVYAERAEIEGFEPVIANVHFTPEALERAGLIDVLPAATRALLVRNGTLKADGTWDESTARALGWKLPAPREGDAAR